MGRKVLNNHLPAGTGGLRDLHISDLITVCFKVNTQSKEDQSPKPRSPRAWTDAPELLISWCFLASQWARICPRQLRQIGWLRPFYRTQYTRQISFYTPAMRGKGSVPLTMAKRRRLPAKAGKYFIRRKSVFIGTAPSSCPVSNSDFKRSI